MMLEPGRSVHPIPLGEGRLSPPITTGTLNVFLLPASLTPNVFNLKQNRRQDWKSFETLRLRKCDDNDHDEKCEKGEKIIKIEKNCMFDKNYNFEKYCTFDKDCT